MPRASGPRPEETTIAVTEEHVVVGKRLVETGRTLIQKSVVEHDAVIDALLQRDDVTVERVAVNQVVEAVPGPRQDGDTWVLPIVAEELVVQTRLVVREEIHIRTVTTREPRREIVRLRREVADITTESSRKHEDTNADDTDADDTDARGVDAPGAEALRRASHE